MLSTSDLLLGVMALGMGVLLAWRSSWGARLLLFGSALLISALLFLPGAQITGWIGKDAVVVLRGLASDTPWDVSDWTHFVIFLWLGLLVWLGRPDLRGWKAWCLVVVLAVAAELAQGLAPARSPEIEDVFLNLAGSMVGILLGMLGHRVATLRQDDSKSDGDFGN